jgi:hypothetical protein
LKATVLLDSIETDFGVLQKKGVDDESDSISFSQTRQEIAKYQKESRRVPNRLNEVSYNIDMTVDTFNRQS